MHSPYGDKIAEEFVLPMFKEEFQMLKEKN